eukprot:TRINITY_DN19813_c0_g1_i1.p1 TRINITY_DN19813_c0_g1~~TRINITY_DN19813_c0_g1_i1.p1  ORF type:complete len:320 (-),score=39.56 TRINITY_DN19813_c0_g1_i1:355-1314(-)
MMGLDMESICAALSRVIGSGCLPLPCAILLARASSSMLKAELDTEVVWRENFSRQFPSASTSMCAVLAALPLIASVPYVQTPSLKRLICREPPSEGLVSHDPATKTDFALEWEASILIYGAPHAGKTWLVNRFCTGLTPARLDTATILGCDLRAALVRVRDGQGNSKVGRVRIWEPSGMSRKQALGRFLQSSAAAVVVVNAADPQAADQACEHLSAVAETMRPGTTLALCATQVDSFHRKDSRKFGVMTKLLAVAVAAEAEFAVCSAKTGEGIDGLFCAILAAASEAGKLKTDSIQPVLSHEAGTLTNSELLRSLLHRR